MNSTDYKFQSVYEGEYGIQNLIKSDNNCSAHFTYSRHPGRGFELVIVTYNPNHKTSFFLHSLYGDTKIDALQKMYEHIFNLKNTLKDKDSNYLNYIVEWYNPKQKRKETSSFYGISIQDVIHKFYYDKHTKTDILIYSIKLNSITNNEVF